MARKVLINLYSKGRAILRAIVVIFLELFYSLTITYLIGKWAVDYAYSVRGYKAYGGEYVLVIAAFLLSFYGVHIFLKFIRR